MLIGPVFTREVVTVPRRARLFVTRSTYVAVLLVLMGTAWSVLTGTQSVRNVGELARFGAMLFQILAPLQLALAILFSALWASSAVSQEKDRRTLILLLLTNLTNSELVLGKLLASLLTVLVMLAAALPAFVLIVLLGGVSFEQVGRVFAVTLAAALAAGSLGGTIAFWRDKTFQALALTALLLAFWLAGWELVGSGAFGANLGGLPANMLAACFSPWQAILLASQPSFSQSSVSGAIDPVNGFVLVTATLAVGLNLLAIARVRVWNPSRQVQIRTEEDERSESIWGIEHDQAQADKAQTDAAGESDRQEPQRSVHDAPGRVRTVWANPILWREICTWAYGRKVLIIRLGYLLMFAICAVVLHYIVTAEGFGRGGSAGIIPDTAPPLIALFILSLVLLNALAVTSITSERDGRALDLLLMTDLTPAEMILGKLGGVLYNTKEMILLPMLLSGYLWWAGGVGGENLAYLLLTLLVMNAFGAMLGIHVGMTYSNSRSAIGVSLGTVLFLCIGIATCMRMMIAFHSFHGQLFPFLAFIGGGGLGLYVALGWRNPSPAIGLASFAAPVATFYAITSFILGSPLAVALVTMTTYGFATIAMLVPAIAEFDVATGRTTSGEE